MGSRLRAHPEHVFEVYCEVATPSSSSSDPTEPFILTKYPENYSDEEILKSIPSFSYPCHISTDNVLHFSFVLTGVDSKWTFGFVRFCKNPVNTCLVLLSSLSWHDCFYKTLNHISSLNNKQDGLFVDKFLEELYNLPIPDPGLSLVVSYCVHAREYEFTAVTPDSTKIPSIPEDRNLTEYYNAVDSSNMIMIFASMLNERRIVMTSSRLGRLTSCVQAANSLIYPMFWQHIFIPVLPPHLLDYLSAPMPFLIGVPSETLKRVKKHELGDVVILDADVNRIDSPFDDLNMLPTEIISFLKKSLRLSQNSTLLGDGVPRTFLRALVMLIGGYRDALSFPQGSKITFSKESFVNSRPSQMQPFLERMLQLQIFQQFIEGRLKMLNEGKGFNDYFELELNLHEDKSVNRFKTQYNEWMLEVKKEGSAIIKSVNPVVKSAYRQVKQTGKQVKDKSRQAYRGIRSKIQQKTTTHMNGSDFLRRPRSAPSSPTGSPVTERRDFPFRVNTGGSANVGNIVKKSISGVIVEKTDKTASYVRGRPNSHHNGIIDSGKPNTENNVELGVEAKESPQKPSLLDLDLMGELSQAFASNVSFNPFENMAPHPFLSPESSSTGTLSFRHNDPFSPVIESKPLFDVSSLDSKNTIQEETESPSDDPLAVFDPLHQKKKPVNSRNSMTAGICVAETVNELNGVSKDFSHFSSNSGSQNYSLKPGSSKSSLVLPRPPISSRTSKGRSSPSVTSMASGNHLLLNAAGSASNQVPVKTNDSLFGLMDDPFKFNAASSNGVNQIRHSSNSSSSLNASGRSWQHFE